MRMIEIKKFERSSGETREKKQQATRHLENVYSNVLMKLTHNILDLPASKLMTIPEYIDSNLDKFKELMIIKEDMQSIKEEFGYE